MSKKFICPECGSHEIIKQGIIWSGRSKVQQYRCKRCGRNTIRPVEAKEPELVPKVA